MNNIEFGNYLYELRKKNEFTQRAVAYQLGVSDKAVSKWEMGKSKPPLEKLKLLSVLYNEPLDKLLNTMETTNKAKIHKIVLTGGPCAGKTTALTWINDYFSKRGYTVLVIPSTAKELLNGGLTPYTCFENYDYQLCRIKLQKEKEKIYEEAAKRLKKDKILIIYEKGMLDSKAYMKEVEFKKALKEIETNEIKERDKYDAVFHLESAAKGKEKEYNLSNRLGKEESPKEARAVDDKIISAWTGHPHFRIIDNNCSFNEKMERLIRDITSFLGEPQPYEIERKFLIEYPNLKELEKMPNCTKVDITQTYLKSSNSTERRIRARGIDGDYLYYLTEKRKVSNVKRVETTKRITKDDYLRLLLEEDNKLHSIHKTRYCLSENSQYFEIDIYPEWRNQAVIEIELNNENQEIKWPKHIKIIKEVTEDNTFKNRQMAKEMPEEII